YGRAERLPPFLELSFQRVFRMLPELYLAEQAFALHLLPQHPQRLVDIVVTDENLHAVFLSIERPGRRLWTVPVPMATVVRISRGRRNTDRHNTEMAVVKSSRSRRQRQN